MADLNVFSFTGRLTKDAEYRTLASGKGLLTAQVAINTGYGEYKKTLFIKAQQWGESGQKVVQYLGKGQLVSACGELSLSKWTSQAGKEYTDIVVDTRSIQILGPSQKSAASSYGQPAASPSQEADPGVPGFNF